MLATKGAPGLMTMTPRRALNMAYYLVVRYMKEADRQEFDDSLEADLDQLIVEHAARVLFESQERDKRIRELAEIGD